MVEDPPEKRKRVQSGKEGSREKMSCELGPHLTRNKRTRVGHTLQAALGAAFDALLVTLGFNSELHVVVESPCDIYCRLLRINRCRTVQASHSTASNLIRYLATTKYRDSHLADAQ